MRYLLFLLVFSMVFLFSCAKEDINVNSTNDLTLQERGKLPKLDVCHYDAENYTWHVININMNAWPAHEAHGDVRLDDPDGDGFYPYNRCGYEPMGDCNDYDAAVYPGAEELCDGIDNNCDGQIDEGCCPYFTVDLIAANGAFEFYDSENGPICFCDDNNSVTIYPTTVYSINANLGEDCLQDGVLTFDGWVYPDEYTIRACQVVLRQAIDELGLSNRCGSYPLANNAIGEPKASTEFGSQNQ